MTLGELPQKWSGCGTLHTSRSSRLELPTSASDRLPALAADLVNSKVAVIYAGGISFGDDAPDFSSSNDEPPTIKTLGLVQTAATI
jgi:hypothetical protein